MRATGLGPAPAFILTAVLGLLAVAGCGGDSGPDTGPDGSPEVVAAEISTFSPQQGRLAPKTRATAAVSVKNTGSGARTFFVGYSVGDARGRVHDAPPVPIEIKPGEEADVRGLETPPLDVPGYYDARVSVWSEKPGRGERNGARRLADRQAPSSFRVSRAREDFDAPGGISPGGGRWRATAHELGRGRLLPRNVGVEGGRLRLTLPADTLGGGEVESGGRHGYGFYAARIKVPDAPSSITGFFLYEPPDLRSEIDIEIFNDHSRKILFTTYAGGRQTSTKTLRLPFDPTRGFHDYAFSYYKSSVIFYVDGVPMSTHEGGLPANPMRLYVNSWFPTWLPEEKPPSDRHAYVDWIEY